MSLPDPELQDRLLKLLKQQQDQFLLPGHLDSLLGVSREAVFDVVTGLRERGYLVDFHPYFGFKLLEIPDALIEAEIREDLNTKDVGRKVFVFESVGSTCDVAWDRLDAEPNLPDGTVVLAEEQLRGRGRLGRSWVSPKGAGIWASVILKPGTGWSAANAPYLTAIGCLAVAHTLNEWAHIPAGVKWPNDVMIGGKKLAGMLLETRPEHPGSFVMGLGLNVHQSKHDLPDDLREVATSIHIERGKPVNRNRLVRHLLFYFDSLYQRAKRKKFRGITDIWLEYNALKGREVLAATAEREVRGKAEALDPLRGLTVQPADGDAVTISPEEVISIRILQ